MAVITGISSDELCPLKRGDKVLIKSPNQRLVESSVLAVEHVLLGHKTEQYALILADCEECVAELAAGTKLYLITDAPAPLPSTSE